MSRFVFTLPFALLLGAAGCNSSGTKPGPCEGANPAPECSAECTTDPDCPDRFFCDVDKTCSADCTVGGGECGSGQACDFDGHCVTEPPLDEGCGRIDVALTPVIPTVVMLVDRSGSMDQGFGNTDRWNAVKEALTDPTNGVAAQLEDQVVFGATLYNSEGGNAGGTCPILHSEAPALQNADNIRTLFDSFGPDQDTPTAESVAAVAADFPDADGPRIIVLATDGDPDNCMDPDAHDQTSQTMSENAVADAYANGIETRVLSVGDQTTASHLQRLANAGSGEDLDTGNATYYVANDPQELVDAFGGIVNGVRGCQVDIEGPVDPDLAPGGVVILNGTILEYDKDWHLIDGDTVELIGAACDALLGAKHVDIKASFPCPVVVD